MRSQSTSRCAGGSAAIEGLLSLRHGRGVGHVTSSAGNKRLHSESRDVFYAIRYLPGEGIHDVYSLLHNKEKLTQVVRHVAVADRVANRTD